MDEWTKKKIGLPAGAALTRRDIEDWQLRRLRETLDLTMEKAPFYRGLLSGSDSRETRGGLEAERQGRPVLERLSDMEKLPFTMPEDLREHGAEMLCVPQSAISRIVTLFTSGTTGKPKRIYFTEADQELTIDYFHHGMQNLVDQSDKVLILMPVRAPGSIGDLLRVGLRRLGAQVCAYGPPDEEAYGEVLRLIEEEGVTSMVAAPFQAQRLLEEVRRQANTAGLAGNEGNQGMAGAMASIRTVLLSAAYVPAALCAALEREWNCTVFEHYGMTEMGLGCAVSCPAASGGAGYHVRESDLYIEIIDSQTGETVPDGRFGEVVFTTLTRRGMPLIRYRTGDVSRWLTGPCQCGSILKRLDKVRDRGREKGGY